HPAHLCFLPYLRCKPGPIGHRPIRAAHALVCLWCANVFGRVPAAEEHALQPVRRALLHRRQHVGVGVEREHDLDLYSAWRTQARAEWQRAADNSMCGMLLKSWAGIWRGSDRTAIQWVYGAFGALTGGGDGGSVGESFRGDVGLY